MRKLTILFFLTMFSTVNAAENSEKLATLPFELVELTKLYKCNPYYELFIAGAIDPPFVFGFIDGKPKQSNAIMYCGNKKERKLLVYINNDYLDESYFRCPKVINGTIAGGMSIERTKIQLHEFFYLDNPKKSGPANITPKGYVIRSDVESASSLLYCYKDKWLVHNKYDR